MLSKKEARGAHQDPPREKLRDISRSILPARQTAAKRARKARRRLHRDERTSAKVRLRHLWDEDAEDELGESRWYRVKIRRFVRERRDGDHDSALVRWARTNRVLQLPLASRLARMKSLLGHGLEGRHAIDHLENLVEYAIPLPERPRAEEFPGLREATENPPFAELARFFQAALDLPAPSRVTFEGYVWTHQSLDLHIRQYLEGEARAISRNNTLGRVKEKGEWKVVDGVVLWKRTKQVVPRSSPPLKLPLLKGRVVSEIEAWLRDLHRRSLLPQHLPTLVRGFVHSSNGIAFVRRQKLNPEYSGIFPRLLEIKWIATILLRRGDPFPSPLTRS